jgi:hypothetical protein
MIELCWLSLVHQFSRPVPGFGYKNEAVYLVAGPPPARVLRMSGLWCLISSKQEEHKLKGQ